MSLDPGTKYALDAMKALKDQNNTNGGFTGSIKVVVEIDIVTGRKALDIKRRQLRFENGILVEAGEIQGTQHNLD